MSKVLKSIKELRVGMVVRLGNDVDPQDNVGVVAEIGTDRYTIKFLGGTEHVFREYNHKSFYQEGANDNWYLCSRLEEALYDKV